MCCNLATQFTSDRAAATCYKDCFAGYIIHDLIHVDIDLLSSKKIFNVDRTQLTDIDFTVYQLIDSRKDF